MLGARHSQFRTKRLCIKFVSPFFFFVVSVFNCFSCFQFHLIFSFVLSFQWQSNLALSRYPKHRARRPIKTLCLEKLVLQSHVRFRLKTNASTEDVGQGSTLLGKSIDDGSTGRSQRSLEHVAENTQNAVEVLVLGGSSTVRGGSLPLDARHHLSNDDQINDQRRGQERVLANVEETVNSQHVSQMR